MQHPVCTLLFIKHVDLLHGTEVHNGMEVKMEYDYGIGMKRCKTVARDCQLR
jgi:hypothetical protein